MKPAGNEAKVLAFRDAAEFELDIGLCYGWISGQRKSYDDVYYLQKYVPRRPRSRWSQANVAKVEELIAPTWPAPPSAASAQFQARNRVCPHEGRLRGRLSDPEGNPYVSKLRFVAVDQTRAAPLRA